MHNGILFRNKQECTMDTLNNMDESTKYYAVRQRPDTKDNIPYNSTYMKLQKDKSNLW